MKRLCLEPSSWTKPSRRSAWRWRPGPPADPRLAAAPLSRVLGGTPGGGATTLPQGSGRLEQTRERLAPAPAQRATSAAGSRLDPQAPRRASGSQPRAIEVRRAARAAQASRRAECCLGEACGTHGVKRSFSACQTSGQRSALFSPTETRRLQVFAPRVVRSASELLVTLQTLRVQGVAMAGSLEPRCASWRGRARDGQGWPVKVQGIKLSQITPELAPPAWADRVTRCPWPTRASSASSPAK